MHYWTRSFRPQQGLLIMNFIIHVVVNIPSTVSVPNRGYLLWIINIGQNRLFEWLRESFRPQQGLLIMNYTRIFTNKY